MWLGFKSYMYRENWDFWGKKSSCLFYLLLLFLICNWFLGLVEEAALTAWRKKGSITPLSITEHIQHRQRYSLYQSVTVSQVYWEMITPRARNYEDTLCSTVQLSVLILYWPAGYRLWQSHFFGTHSRWGLCEREWLLVAPKLCTNLGAAALYQPSSWATPSCEQPEISLVDGSFFSTGLPLIN